MKEIPLNIRITVLSRNCIRLQSWGRRDVSYCAPYWRFYWNANRGARVHSQGRVVPLVPSHYVLIPPNTDFSGELLVPATHLCVHFEAAPPYDSIDPGIYRGRVDATVRRLIGQARAEPRVDDDRVGYRSAMSVLALLHVALAGLPRTVLRTRPADDRIDRVLHLMAGRLDRACPNAELAETAGMNVNAFVRRFGEVTGDSPQHYHLRQRVERACVLLHFGSERECDQIAERTGFCDRYHFSNVFKRLRGISPAAFRRLRKSKVSP